MKHVQQPLRVGIWGRYHGGNLGDDVVVATLIRNIRALRPRAEIFGVSIDPEDTSQRHGMPAVSMSKGTVYRDGERVPYRDGDNAPLARVAGALEQKASKPLQKAARKMHALSSVRQAWAMLREADLLIVAGSHPLYDGWAGPWAHPFDLFTWAMLARITGTKFVPLNVGAGPIDAPLSRFFVRSALRTAYYRSFRDPSSARYYASIGGKGRTPVFPDLAFSLPEPEIERRRSGRSPEAEPDVIGISTMAHHDPRYLPGGDVRRYRAYLEKLASFSSWLLDEGYTLQLLRSQVEADERVAAALKDRLAARGIDLDGRVRAEPTRTYRDLLDQMAQCDIVVGGRFHCHVLPFVLGKPVLGVAYHQKTFDLMRYMGQSEYCLDIDDMGAHHMIERFQRLRRRRAAVVDTVEHRVRVCREMLDFQYHLLFREDRAPDLDQTYVPTADGRALEKVGVRLRTRTSAAERIRPTVTQ